MELDAESPDELAVHRLSRERYERIVQSGALDESKVELLHGLIVEMSPISSLHAETVKRLTKLFVLALGDRADVLVQSSFAATDDSEPEPDLLIAPAADYSAALPSQALLVIEVAESSLRRDRLKAAVYAASGIPEYWIVDVRRRVVERYSAPAPGTYTERDEHGPGAVLRPLTLPDIAVPVDGILPRG